MEREQIHFVTGWLAEPLLRSVLDDLAPRAGFDFSIDVLGISVAALMTPGWIASRLRVPATATRVMIPGYCGGDLQPIADVCRVPVERGPKDLRRLPEHFGKGSASMDPPAKYDIEILAEINHAPRMELSAILTEAAQLKAAGADVIDLGCDPGNTWHGVAEAVRALRDAGHRVSIDSLNVDEIAAATQAGAELVLSVNQSNRDAAADWNCEVVAIPDTPSDLSSLEATIDVLEAKRVRYRIDPVIEPIGFGFAASLGRYLEARRRWPQVEMLMGIGNLTELTEVDSAGVNLLLLGFCQELKIRSVLTTQVINWCRSAVHECDLARRLVHYAITNQALPKHVDSRLLVARDAKVPEYADAELDELSERLKDPNYRLFVAAGELHAVRAGLHLANVDPYDLFAGLLAQDASRIDVTHAFYLGFELAKATTALTLGKEYRQDEALDWGFLTRAEPTLHERRLQKPAAELSRPEAAPSPEETL